MRFLIKRTWVAGATVLVAASLATSACGSNGSSNAASCLSQHAAAGTAGTAPGGSPGPAVAAAWTLPGADLQNTRDVASAITASNVAQLGVAWCVPVESTGDARSAGLTDGYTATPVVVDGVVYLQDMESNVMAVRLATGAILLKTPLSSGDNAPVAIDGDYVIAGAGVQAPATARQLIIAYRVGADGKLPDTVAR